MYCLNSPPLHSVHLYLLKLVLLFLFTKTGKLHSHITLPYNRQLKFLKFVNKTLLMHTVDFEEDFEDSHPTGPGDKLFCVYFM